MTWSRNFVIQIFSMKSTGMLPTKSGLHPYNQAGSTTHLPAVEDKEGRNGKDYSNGRRALQKPRLLLPHFTIIMFLTALSRWQIFSAMCLLQSASKNTATKKYQVAMPKQPMPKQTSALHITQKHLDSVITSITFQIHLCHQPNHVQRGNYITKPKQCTRNKGNLSSSPYNLHQVLIPPKMGPM